MRARPVPLLPLLGAALLLAAPARATSFANNELGLGLGASTVVPQGGGAPWLLANLSLEWASYLDHGFVFLAQVQLSLETQQAGTEARFALGGQLGVRYLFLQEAVRPYVQLHLAGFNVFRDTSPTFYGGPGGGVGVDLFVSDSVALGARATADCLITAEGSDSHLVPRAGLGGALTVHVYF